MKRVKTKLREIDGLPVNKYNPHCLIAGNPQIGEDTWIGAFCVIDSKHAKLIIGKGCNVANGVKIMTHSTVRRCLSEGKIKKIDTAETTIGDYCFIGANAVILMGSNIGHHSVVGAGCVIPEGMKIPPYSVVAGVPGKIKGSSKKFFK